MVMRHYGAKRNVMFDHQVRGEASSAINGGGAITTAMFTHLDADAVAISWAIVVGMFALFIGWHVLHGDFIIHGVVPDKVADAVAAFALGRA